jgi:predicted nucleic acid-binding protein
LPTSEREGLAKLAEDLRARAAQEHHHALLAEIMDTAGASLEQLSRLTQHLIGLPVTIDVVEEAAALAERLPDGKVSAADADLLLAAQAKLGAAVWVRADESLASVASNLGVDVRSWRTIDAAG